jgi:L-fuculose-phosphate aldolase
VAEAGEASLRRSIVEAGLDLERTGLSPQKSGNISARLGDLVLITPSGVAYAALAPGDLVTLGMDGSVVAGSLAPSSEWPMHLAIYRDRADTRGIVHAHSDHATSLAVLKRNIPAFHYMVAVAGGRDIRCAPYATFGSEELAADAVAALRGRKACLLAHHGQIALGESVEAALQLAHEVEMLAGQYWRALQIGTPELLSDDEMERVALKFRTYGRPSG